MKAEFIGGEIVVHSPSKAMEMDATAKITPDQMRSPAPDFVVEVLSETTEAVDRGIKLRDRAAHGSVRSVAIDGFELELDQIFTA